MSKGIYSLKYFSKLQYIAGLSHCPNRLEELNAKLVSLVGEKWGRDANKCYKKQEKHIRP